VERRATPRPGEEATEEGAEEEGLLLALPRLLLPPALVAEAEEPPRRSTPAKRVLAREEEDEAEPEPTGVAPLRPLPVADGAARPRRREPLLLEVVEEEGCRPGMADASRTRPRSGEATPRVLLLMPPADLALSPDPSRTSEPVDGT
jgi:hypothetical protein